MPVYRIELHPTVPFFFGSSRNAEWGNKRNYYAKSAKFPQQTTVLGMLRYQLLLQNNCIHEDKWGIKDKNKAVNLVGNESFPSQDHKYGVIEQISPVYLHKDEENFYVSKTDARIQDEVGNLSSQQASYVPVEGNDPLHKAVNLLHPAQISPAWKFDPFTEKNGFQEKLIGDKGSNHDDLSKVFKEVISSHNNKSLRGTNLEKAYFKELRYRLQDDFSFCCFVLLNSSNVSFKIADNIVRLGGRQSWFKMTVKELKGQQEIPDEFVRKSNVEKILLLSDAFVKSDYANHCRAVAATTIPFRNIQTKIQTTINYHSLSNEDAKSPSISNTRLLLERGSVLHLKAGKTWTDIAIENEEQVKIIGFNHTISI